MFLSYNLVPENVEEKRKRQLIETALRNPNTSLTEWQNFAKTDYGLVSGMFPLCAGTQNAF